MISISLYLKLCYINNIMYITIITFGSSENFINQFKRVYSPNNEYIVHYNKRDYYKLHDEYKKIRSFLKQYTNVTLISKYKIY